MEVIFDIRSGCATSAELGFRWVTFIPTWLVADEVPLRIGDGPPLTELTEAAQAFVEAGFNVKFEPHLDFVPAAGQPYEWRRRMYFEPGGAYTDRVIAPLAGIAGEAQRHGAQCAFSLGSELAVSLAEFGAQWEALFDMLRPAYPNLPFGHNIDPDSLQPGTEIRKPLNTERARRGLPPLGWREHHERLAAVHHYLGRLDYAGFSFYPNVKSARSDRWWRQQTTGIQTRIIGRAFLKNLQKLISRLRRMAGEKPQFAIGEFGIGCADPARPWHTDSTTFLTAEGLLDGGAAELRRKYHLGLLECLRKAPHLFGEHPVTYWTVTHYDFTGALEQPGSDLFRDEILRQAVSRYNTGLK